MAKDRTTANCDAKGKPLEIQTATLKAALQILREVGDKSVGYEQIDVLQNAKSIFERQAGALAAQSPDSSESIAKYQRAGSALHTAITSKNFKLDEKVLEEIRQLTKSHEQMHGQVLRACISSSIGLAPN